MRRIGYGLCLVTCWASFAQGAEGWTRFRGPNGQGVVKGETAPDALDPEKNQLWKVACPSGGSSPVIVGDRIFITGLEGDDRLVLAYDRANGNKLWEARIPKSRTERATPPNTPAMPTPAADDKALYVLFTDVGLVSYTFDGEERWRTAVGPFNSFHGIATSPVLVNGKVILQIDQSEQSFLAAYDSETGAERWKAPRLDGALGGYSTPMVRTTESGESELLVTGPFDIAGFNIETGAQTWSIEGLTNMPVSAPLLVGNAVYTCEPSFEENPFSMAMLSPLDANKDKLLQFAELERDPRLIRIGKRVDENFGNKDGAVSGEELDAAFARFVGGGGLARTDLNVGETPVRAEIKWTYRKATPHIPSLLMDEGVLYFINDGGIFSSVDPDSGEIIKRARVNGSRFYASPVATGGKLYLIDIEGNGCVVQAGAEWNELSKFKFGEQCFATPAIADGRVYVRLEGSLRCFGG